MKNIARLFIASTCTLLLALTIAAPALAQQASSGFGADVQSGFNTALKAGGLIQGDTRPALEVTIGTFINSILGLIGAATFVLVVYAGGLWITAAGNDEKVSKAKDILKGAVLGLVIIFTAYVLVNAALTALEQSIKTGP